MIFLINKLRTYSCMHLSISGLDNEHLGVQISSFPIGWTSAFCDASPPPPPPPPVTRTHSAAGHLDNYYRKCRHSAKKFIKITTTTKNLSCPPTPWAKTPTPPTNSRLPTLIPRKPRFCLDYKPLFFQSWACNIFFIWQKTTTRQRIKAKICVQKRCPSESKWSLDNLAATISVLLLL